MASLTYQLKGMCGHAAYGSYGTKAERVKNLAFMASQLKGLGYKLKNITNLKPKHVSALVDSWKADGLAVGTIKNRMAHLRYWAENVGKSSIIKSNEDYGIERRNMYKGDNSQRLNLAKLATIQDKNIQMSLRLQAAFGLRREEAMKIKPGRADQGDYIALAPSWCKGGRARVIPITNDRQRALLDEAKALAGVGSMIPAHKSYKEHLKHYENVTLKAGLKNNHGLRHNYAQYRYKVLTGMQPPTITGRKFSDLTAEQKRLDGEARQAISHELGHGRIDVTNIYLGGRK